MPASFTPKIRGHPMPQISWCKDRKPLNLEDDLIKMTPSEDMITLHIDKARASDRGQYKLDLKNEVGNASASANLVVHGKNLQSKLILVIHNYTSKGSCGSQKNCKKNWMMKKLYSVYLTVENN